MNRATPDHRAHMHARLHARLRVAMFALFALGMAALPVRAEQFISVGAYKVHYVVVGTTFLSPEVARRYGLDRNRDVAMINISVLRAGKPVPARVTGVARDLLSREQPLRFREIREQPAVYYLATMRFEDQEHWRFLLDVQPQGEPAPLRVRFEQRLYEE
jgi:hypothetical protein